jgi:hypothetical protein
MSEPDLTPLIQASRKLGRVEAKKELQDRIADLHRPVEIVSEVILWLKESEAN